MSSPRLFHIMVGCLETTIFIGASTALTIILKKKKLKCYCEENTLTVEMILEMKRKASEHSLFGKCIPCR